MFDTNPNLPERVKERQKENLFEASSSENGLLLQLLLWQPDSSGFPSITASVGALVGDRWDLCERGGHRKVKQRGKRR